MSYHALRGYDGRFNAAAAPMMPLPLAIAIYNRCLASACRQHGFDLKWVLRQLARPQRSAFARAGAICLGWDDDWMQARRICQLAFYVANTEFGVMQAHIANIVGIHRSNVGRALREIEDARDDRAYDALINRIAADAKRDT